MVPGWFEDLSKFLGTIRAEENRGLWVRLVQFAYLRDDRELVESAIATFRLGGPIALEELLDAVRRTPEPER
jgi:hypothetical protein